MLFSRAQEVLGIQEAEVLMDMLTPGEMFDAWRSDTQAGFSLVRSQLEISEAAVKKEIVGVHQRIDSLELRVSSLELKFAHLEEKFEFLFRYFSATNSYKNHFSKFQEILVIQLKSRSLIHTEVEEANAKGRNTFGAVRAN